MGLLPVPAPQATLGAQWLKAPGTLPELVLLRPRSKQGPQQTGLLLLGQLAVLRSTPSGWALLVGQTSPKRAGNGSGGRGGCLG